MLLERGVRRRDRLAPARKVPLVRLIQARALSPASVLEPHRIVEKTGDGHECRYARRSVSILTRTR